MKDVLLDYLTKILYSASSSFSKHQNHRLAEPAEIKSRLESIELSEYTIHNALD